MRLTPAVVLVIGFLAAPARSQDAVTPPPAPLLLNGSFDDTPATPSKWDFFETSRIGNNAIKSEVAIDATVAKSGKQSLRLAGSGGVASFQGVRQRHAAAPGDRVTVRAAARCAGVRREGAQNPSTGIMLEFVDAKNARLASAWTPLLTGDRDWTELVASWIAPANTAAVFVVLVLNQSGTVWYDDVRLEAAPATLADAPGRAAALAAVQDHLRATYPFFGLNGKPHVDEWCASWTPRLAEAKDEETFVTGLKTMLGQLDDLHVWLKRAGKLVPTAMLAPVRGNLAPATRKAVITEWIDEQPPVLAGRIGAGAEAVGYVEIGTWQMKEDLLARLEKDLDALGDCKGIVIDVRANTGGDETVAQRIASRFCSQELVYARSRYREPLGKGEDALGPPVDRTLAPRKDAKPDVRPVAVLQGRNCISSTEGFLMMARALPTVTTIGERSRGASGKPQLFLIAPDLQLMASTWRAYTPDDVLIEGAGVPPEQVVEFEKNRDAPLEAAVALIRK